MKYEIKFERDHWKKLSAETVIDLGFDQRELHITSVKADRGGLVCRATCVQRTEPGVFCWTPYQDFTATLATSEHKGTQGALERLQLKGLEDLDNLILAVKKHYGVRA